MKKFAVVVVLLVLLAGSPARAEEPASGPALIFNNVYQTLGPCAGLPRVTGVMETCGRTLIVKAGGTP